MDNNQLTDEEKKAKRLEQLAKAREKAIEKRKMLGELRRQEKQVKEEVVLDRIKKLQMLKSTTQPNEDSEEEDEPKPTKKSAPKVAKKKVVKKVIEVSDSSSDDGSSSESDGEPQVEYIVRRTKKTVKEAKPTKSKKDDYEDYETPRLSAEVAKSVLKKRVMDDAKSMAFKSLFPYHNF
jgi:hypothetical protein